MFFFSYFLFFFIFFVFSSFIFWSFGLITFETVSTSNDLKYTIRIASLTIFGKAKDLEWNGGRWRQCQSYSLRLLSHALWLYILLCVLETCGIHCGTVLIQIVNHMIYILVCVWALIYTNVYMYLCAVYICALCAILKERHSRDISQFWMECLGIRRRHWEFGKVENGYYNFKAFDFGFWCAEKQWICFEDSAKDTT